MAATLESSRLYSFTHDEEIRGGESQVVYSVNVSSPTVGQEVITLAQGASSGDAVPAFGAAFSITVDGTTHTDNDIFVRRLTARQRSSGPEGRLKWWVTATYRSPERGNVIAPPDINLDPPLRAFEFWTESLVFSEERRYGKNQEEILWPWQENANDPKSDPAARNKDTLGPVSNAGGFQYGSAPSIQRRLPIFVLKRNVRNPFGWIGINQAYEKHVNSTTWNVFNTGQEVSARTCVLLSIETSRPKYWNQLAYYELECRVLYNPEGHDIKVPNFGDRVWEKSKTGEWTVGTPFAGGLPQQPPVFLNGLGGLRSDQTGVADELTFRDLSVKDFSGLTSGIAGLT